jgi:cryptochrome
VYRLECLADLDHNLQNINSESGLLVARGNPLEVLPVLWKKWQINLLTFELDTEPYAKMRDAKVMKLAKEHGVDVVSYHGHTLFNPNDLLNNDGTAPLTYQSFCSVASRLGAPAQSAPAPSQLPPIVFPEDMKRAEFVVPTLEELNIKSDDITTTHRGGESVALKRMEAYLKNEKAVRKFEKPKTNPASFNPAATTVLSPYLKFGCLSARLFYHKLKAVYNKNPKEASKPPVSLEGQLLWREFFYNCGAHIPNFDRMNGNQVCKQIPWRTDEKAAEDFKAWAEGRTGYPWIDAIMIQLRQEGWIHHLARHSVACFLTRGDLFVHWEWGFKEFEKLLLDADWSINAGNWLWLR